MDTGQINEKKEGIVMLYKLNSKNILINFIIFILLIIAPSVLHAESIADEKPDLEFERKSFSPDHDGFADYLVFRPGKKARRYKRIQNWKIEIKNSAGETIRTYSADRRFISERPSWSNFYLPDPVKSENLHLFSEIAWDGRDNKGEMVREGDYTVTGSISSGKWSGISQFSEYRIYLMLNTIDIKLTALKTRIATSRDSSELLPGENPTDIQIRQEIYNPEKYLFKGEILDSRNKVCYSESWKNNLPQVFKWNAFRNPEDKKYFREGIYTYRLSVKDSALNAASAEYNNITIAPKESRLEVICNKRYFGRGTLSCSLNPYPEDQKFLKNWRKSMQITEWKMEVFPEGGKKAVYSHTNKGDIPDSIEWDGRDNNYQILSDDTYFIRVTADTAYGVLVTPDKPVVLDKVSPDAIVYPGRREFSPDGYGSSQRIRFFMLSNDPSGIDSWKLRIYLKASGEKYTGRIPYRTFSGKGDLPESVTWYGESDDGIAAESFESYSADLTVTDRAGNATVSRTGNIRTGAVLRLISRESSELRMIIPAESLFSSSQELLPEADSIIKETARELKNYPAYKINIMAALRPDNKTDDRTSVVFTEQLAMQVYTGLKRYGVPVNRMNYEGIGFTDQLTPKNDPIQILRNTRIQLILTPVSGK
jgi:hypothetical protein